MIHLDTQALVWIYGRKQDRIPVAAQQCIDTAERLAISPMVELELAYLFERAGGRATRRGARRTESTLDLTVCTAPFPVVVRHASRMTWARDLFDRILANLERAGWG